MTPGWFFSDELERLVKSFDPTKWSGDRREIETAFGDLETRLKREHEEARKVYAKGYEQRAVDEGTNEIWMRLRENMDTLSMDQKYGSQEAMNQLRNGVRRDLATNSHYQQQRNDAVSDYANDQAEQLKSLYDREAETLQANGFELDNTNEEAERRTFFANMKEVDREAEHKRNGRDSY